MQLVIGLGNPGKEYEKTRHNIGREVIVAFAKEHEFASWKTEKKLAAEISKGRIGDQDVILALPTTFMNESGRSVQALISTFSAKGGSASGGNLNLSTLIIAHDDIDLPLGSLRFSFDASSGGQRGVQSIIDALGTKAFVRLRIGVAGSTRSRTDAAAYVLKPFALTERLAVSRTKKRAVAALADYIEHGLDHARTLFNGKEKGA